MRFLILLICQEVKVIESLGHVGGHLTLYAEGPVSNVRPGTCHHVVCFCTGKCRSNKMKDRSDRKTRKET
jgi:hypothetical protein